MEQSAEKKKRPRWRPVLVHVSADGGASRREAGQHAGDGCGHERRRSIRPAPPSDQAREIVAPSGARPADAADLDRDRAEVGEAAQRVGRDQLALFAELTRLGLALDDVGQCR
jgi:hypothetical protein